MAGSLIRTSMWRHLEKENAEKGKEAMPPLFDVNCEVVNDWANTMKQQANNHCVPAP